MVMRDIIMAILTDLAAHDEQHDEQWADIRGPLITCALVTRHGPLTGLAMHRLEKLGLIVRADRSELRTNVTSWPSPQPWCQPWRLTTAGRACANWPSLSVH
jgi:hypothetical protein